jgi:uncharacterized protein (DUF1015 family)
MAEIRPFRALRYDTEKVTLADVVTQPYDKITSEMQAGYYQRHPANFVRFELPKPGSEDVYEGARDFLKELRRQGLIRLEEQPAFYVYEQEFEHPSESKKLRRRALIVLGRLHEYSDGVVYRHEQTLTGPKKDRRQLLKTTRVQSGLLFMMYDDPIRTVEQLQARSAAEFVDDVGVKQRLWTVTDGDAIRQIQNAFRDKSLFIADGHHRYETALALRRSREGKHAEDFAMMALVNMRSEGLVVLPTHRTVYEVEAERFASAMERMLSDFGMRTLELRDPEKLTGILRSTSGAGFSTVVVMADVAFLLDVERERLKTRFPKGAFELDVEALHTLFAELLGISAADVTAQRHVRYHRYAEEALKDVREGAQAAFLIRPVPIEVIRDRSLRGALMPQKSTDFYPKMNSGLIMYMWDESF